MRTFIAYLLVGLVCVQGTAAELPLHDTFETFDGNKYNVFLPHRDAAVEIGVAGDDTELQLRNGAVVETESFQENLHAAVRSAYESDNRDPDNPEIQTFAIRSDGKVKNGVLQNGLAFRLHTFSGLLELVEYVDGKGKVLDKKKIRLVKKGAAIPRGDFVNWYEHHIRDDGKRVEVVTTAGNVALRGTYDIKNHPENKFVMFNSLRPRDPASFHQTFLRDLHIEKNES